MGPLPRNFERQHLISCILVNLYASICTSFLHQFMVFNLKIKVLFHVDTSMFLLGVKKAQALNIEADMSPASSPKYVPGLTYLCYRLV